MKKYFPLIFALVYFFNSCSKKEPFFLVSKCTSHTIYLDESKKHLNFEVDSIEKFEPVNSSYIEIHLSEFYPEGERRYIGCWNDVTSKDNSNDNNKMSFKIVSHYIADSNKKPIIFINTAHLLSFMEEHNYILFSQDERKSQPDNSFKTVYFTFKKK